LFFKFFENVGEERTNRTIIWQFHHLYWPLLRIKAYVSSSTLGLQKLSEETIWDLEFSWELTRVSASKVNLTFLSSLFHCLNF